MSKPSNTTIDTEELNKTLEDGVKLIPRARRIMEMFDGWSSSYTDSHDVCSDCWKKIVAYILDNQRDKRG